MQRLRKKTIDGGGIEKEERIYAEKEAKDDQSNDTVRAVKWQRLANVLQNKTNSRLSSTEYLIGRASLMIAAVAFLVPAILEQEMHWLFFLLSFVSVVVSLILMAISIFTAPVVPIDPRRMIDDLKDDDRSDNPMSERDFSVWLCRSYRDGLEGYDKDYIKNRNLQKWSIGLLILAISLLFINKGIIMLSEQKQNYIPEPSVTREKRSFELEKSNNSNSRIPAPSVTTCLNESDSKDKKK